MLACRCRTFVPKKKILWKWIWIRSSHSFPLIHFMYLWTYVSVCWLNLMALYSLVGACYACLFLYPHIMAMIPLQEGMFWKLPVNFSSGWVVLMLRKPLTFRSPCSASVKEPFGVLNLAVSFTKLSLPLEVDHKIWVSCLPPLLHQEPPAGRDWDKYLRISKSWYISWHGVGPWRSFVERLPEAICNTEGEGDKCQRVSVMSPTQNCLLKTIGFS